MAPKARRSKKPTGTAMISTGGRAPTKSQIAKERRQEKLAKLALEKQMEEEKRQRWRELANKARDDRQKARELRSAAAQQQ